MPDPTPEQFNLIAQQVLKTAPTGLSQEQFLDLIHSKLADPNGAFTGTHGQFDWPIMAAKTAAGDIASPILHPINTVKSLAHAVQHPLDTASDMVNGGFDTLDKVLQTGDPEAAGHILAMVVAPKIYGGALKGVNSAAEALADSPKAAGTMGYVGGAVGSGATIGHPFIGGNVGRAMGPLIQKGASSVAGSTQWLMDKLGIGEPAADADAAAVNKFWGGDKPTGVPSSGVKVNTTPDVWDRVLGSKEPLAPPSDVRPTGAAARQGAALTSFQTELEKQLTQSLNRNTPIAATPEGLSSVDRAIASAKQEAARTRSISQRLQDTTTATEQRADSDYYTQQQRSAAVAEGTIRQNLSSALDNIPGAGNALPDLDSAISDEQKAAAQRRSASAKEATQGQRAEDIADLENLRKPQSAPSPAASSPQSLEDMLTQALVDKGLDPSKIISVSAPRGAGIQPTALGPTGRVQPVTGMGAASDVAATEGGASPSAAPSSDAPPSSALLKKPADLTTQDWKDLRGYYGSVEAAQKMGVSPDDVVRLSGGGPSQTPTIARLRIAEAARRAAQDQ